MGTGAITLLKNGATVNSGTISITSKFEIPPVVCGNPTPTPTPAQTTVQFTSAVYTASEAAGSALVTVNRIGDASQAASVDYATANDTASDRKDYIASVGTLSFAPGETSKSFSVLLIDNAYVDGLRNVNLTLSNPNGATLGAQKQSVLTIHDNDSSSVTSNPINNVPFFVREQYIDFFSREPDAAGMQFWTNQLNSLLSKCDSITNPSQKSGCILSQRALVSAAFFLSTEFQQTGYFVIRFYAVSFNRQPTLREFLTDAQAVGRGVVVGQPGWEQLLEQNKQQFAANWVNRATFKARYDSASSMDYLNALFANGSAGDEQTLRNSLLNGLMNNTETRATALRKVADSNTIFNKQYNSAFVPLQYFGYLRRNPSDAPDTNLDGYNFWLSKLNQFTQPGEDAQQADRGLARVRRAEMIEAFIDSAEYKRRFGTGQ